MIIINILVVSKSHYTEVCIMTAIAVALVHLDFSLTRRNPY